MRRRVPAAESATAATCGRLLGEAAAAEGKVRKFGTFGRRGILYLRSFLPAFAVDAAPKYLLCARGRDVAVYVYGSTEKGCVAVEQRELYDIYI